jgi:hypothetical protein
MLKRALAPAHERIILARMGTGTAHLLSEFDRLPPDEQREFSAIIIRRTAQIDYGDITDEEMTASAAKVFAMLDAEEDAHAR